MNGDEASTEEQRDALMREASTWFARMRGPHAATHEEEFQAWLGRGALHRAAYNRAAEIFAMGKLLADDAPAAPNLWSAGRLALVTGLLALLAASLWLLLVAGADVVPRAPVAIAAVEQRRLSTGPNETRTVRLADGSLVGLGARTILEVTIDASQRRLALVAGGARFKVKRDGRPFRVHAAGGLVAARGTLFDVRFVQDGSVAVHLIEGAVDVTLPATTGAARPGRRMQAGESLSFRAGPVARETLPSDAAPVSSAPVGDAISDVEGLAVDDLIALASRSGGPAIRLADPSFGRRRVAGRFRTDDPVVLAGRLAILLGLEIERAPGGDIVLR